MKKLPTSFSVISSLALIIGALQFLLSTSTACNSVEQTAPPGPAAYIGSSTCQSCHAQEHRLWQESDHHKALALANDSTVLGDFNNGVLESDGIRSRFFKERDTFYIETEGEDGTLHVFPIQYVIGHYPLQQYMVAFPGGRYQVTRQSWDSREGKWFHQYAGEQIPAGDWLHWTGNGQNWNTMCASCHSTHLQKQYDYSTDSYQTTFAERTLGCESCHGPGSNHQSEVANGQYANRQEYGVIQAEQVVNTCMPCHARKTDLHSVQRVSSEWLDNYIPQLISDDFYFADGQVKEEDYVFGSFVQSKMFQEGVQCLNCHQPHSGKLVQSGNALCLQCHEPSYAGITHHFHAEEGEGAQCINCHMPERTYMGNDHRRDHSFRIPRPDQSVEYGTPNACNACHSDESNQWAADQIDNWYGEERAHHFSDELLPGSQRNAESVAHLVALLNDSTQPLIARATAVYYLGQIQDSTAAQVVRNVLSHRDAWIRHEALNALNAQPVQDWLALAHSLLQDPVKAVRIAAARLFHSSGAYQQLATEARQHYQAARQEYEAYLHLQADFSVGALQLADFHLQDGNAQEAVQWYGRALDKDQQMNYARLNLASALGGLQRPQEALQVLKQALQQDAQNPRIHYNLALLYLELNQIDAAEQHFQEAIVLNIPSSGAFGNYALMLLQQGRFEAVLPLCKKGLERYPQDEKLLYAWAMASIESHKPKEAIKALQRLTKLFPDNGYYREWLTQLSDPST